MRLVIARCSVDYAGRLTAHLPLATRLLLVKADGSVLVHSDGGSYKPLNWMSPPCSARPTRGSTDGTGAGVGRSGPCSTPRPTTASSSTIDEVLHDSPHELGVDPGLVKDGVEAHLQELLAEQVDTLGRGLARWSGASTPPPIGPVDLLCRDADGASVAVEIKRRGEIDGVEQLTRYLELLNRDPLLAPVRGRLRRPGDQAAGAGPGRRSRHPLRDARLRRPARSRHLRAPALLTARDEGLLSSRSPRIP